MTTGYRFTRRPLWIFGHVLAVTAIVGFIMLGQWQVQRHRDRTELDALTAARPNAPVLTLSEATALSPAERELRRVSLEGTFHPKEELILQARSHNGRSGHNVITPFVMDDDRSAVLVNRGWIPIDTAGPPVADAPPPTGRVAIVGLVRATEIRGNFGPVDPPDGVLTRVNRVDIERIRQQSDRPLVDFYVQLMEPDDPDVLPLVLNVPAPGSGPPHLAYAVQWFAFAGVVAIGYPALLRYTARRS